MSSIISSALERTYFSFELRNKIDLVVATTTVALITAALWKGVRWCYSFYNYKCALKEMEFTQVFAKPENNPDIGPVLDKVKKIVMEKLSAAHIQPQIIYSNSYEKQCVQPYKRAIPYLICLYDKCIDELGRALDPDKSRVWNESESKWDKNQPRSFKELSSQWQSNEQLATDLMYLGYTITALTLEDFSLNWKQLSPSDLSSKEEALKSQGNYGYRTFFHGFRAYNYLRKFIDVYTEKNVRDVDRIVFEIQPQVRIDELTLVNPEISSNFYETGKIQNEWRLLNNHLCDIFNQLFDVSEVQRLDQRFTRWALKDDDDAVSRKEFNKRQAPDTIPT